MADTGTRGAGAVDFRLRPPLGAFLNTLMYADIERSIGKAVGVGSRVPDSALQRRMDLLIAEMDAAGIGVGVITGRTDSVFGGVPNADIAKIIAAYPQRFVGFAGVDPASRQEAIATIDQAMASGFKGVALEPGARNNPITCDDGRLYPIYAHCEDRDVLVLIMSGGNAGPDLTYSHPAAIDRVARDFPALTIIAGHGNWPWASQIIHICYRRQNIYLSPDVYLNPMLSGALDYVNAANGFMAKRFLFGSAYPFSALDDAMRFMNELPFRPEVRDLVLQGNARRLLKLDAAGA